jgi:DNA-binding PadR family transcriptional regulator
MHVYRMQQLIKERHKDDVVNVTQRNSLYQTIQRLVRDELIVIDATERSENRPERTTYRITGAGRSTLRAWLLRMVAEPAAEYPQFPAALAFLPNLAPAEAIAALGDRAVRLDERRASLAAEIAQGSTFLPRIFLIETEYALRMVVEELAYVRALVRDVETGAVAWPRAEDAS